VYRSAFECSKVLVSPRLLGILKHRKYTAYAINPCIHAGFTHFRLIESLLLRHIFNYLRDLRSVSPPHAVRVPVQPPLECPSAISSVSAYRFIVVRKSRLAFAAQ